MVAGSHLLVIPVHMFSDSSRQADVGIGYTAIAYDSFCISTSDILEDRL